MKRNRIVPLRSKRRLLVPKKNRPRWVQKAKKFLHDRNDDLMTAELIFQDKGPDVVYCNWQICLQGQFVGFLYLLNDSNLTPDRLILEEELIIETIY